MKEEKERSKTLFGEFLGLSSDENKEKLLRVQMLNREGRMGGLNS